MNPETPPTNTENQQPNNPVASTVTTPPASSGGMRVIQPSPGNVVASETNAPQVVGEQPVSSMTTTPTVATPPNPQNVYPQPQTSMSRMDIESEVKKDTRKRRIKKFLLITPIFLIIFGGAGFVLATNQNVRATVFRQKFVTFNYPLCKTHTCTIKFYRGSKIDSYTPWTPPGQAPAKASMVLMSPVINSKTNIIMRIAPVKLNSASLQALSKQNNCSAPGETSGFTENLPNLGTTANICAVTSDNGLMVLGYLGAIVSQKDGAIFDVIINENLTLNAQGQYLGSSSFDLSNYASDIQSILASLNVK